MRRGHVIDLAVAVAVALGAAFGDLVKAFVNGIVMPLVGYVLPTRMAWDEWTLGKVRIGLVAGATVHFVIVSSVVFLLCVKLLDTLLEEEEVVQAAKPTRRCPECLSLIPLAATRCRFCAIPLPGPGPLPEPGPDPLPGPGTPSS